MPIRHCPALLPLVLLLAAGCSGDSGSDSSGSETTQGECPAGEETCRCNADGTCNAGLTCADAVCVADATGTTTGACVPPDTTSAGATPCADGHLAFVTEGEWDGGMIGGLGGADSKCQEEADCAALGGVWKAVVSGSTAANERISLCGDVFDIEGDMIATMDTWWDAVHAAPINTLATGDPVASGVWVWTGTVDGGAAATSHCNSWMSDGQLAVVGIANNEASWLDKGDVESCMQMHSLYCINQG